MTKFYAPLTLVLILLFSTGEAVAADEEMITLLKELKSEIKALKSQAEKANARITELEKQLTEKSRNQSQQTASQQQKPDAQAADKAQGAPPTTVTADSAPTQGDKARDKPAITVGDIKGTFKIPGTDTSIGMGGFVKTDVLFSNISAGSDKAGDQQLVFSDIPVGAAPGEQSQITFIAKDSRLWFRSFTPGQWGDINTYIEFDFNGDPKTYTYTPRLRHGYGSLGNFLAGQTWTTYLNTSALADHLDIGNSAGAVAKLRQPLLRWTETFKWLDTPIEFQAALESPRSVLSMDPNLTDLSTANDDRYPDLVARFNFNPDWGNLSLAALGKQVRFTNQTGLQTETWGGGINFAGKINTIGLDNLRFMAHFGKGVGRYVATPNTFEDAALTAGEEMELVKTYGGMLSYQHWWNKQWRSSLTYGYAYADQPIFVNSALNQQIQSVHANLLWNPVSQAVFGIEYIYAARELIDGRSGDLQRVQLSARYNF